MLVKVDKLIGPALDWAVAKCINPLYGMVGIHQDNRDRWHVTLHGERGCFAPSTNWAQGGPIVDSNPRIVPAYDERFDSWFAYKQSPVLYGKQSFLVSAMRAYVASKLGDEVEVPDEIFKG